MTDKIQETEQGLPILYSFRRCPYAIRARMALKYSGIAVTIREIVLRNKPQAMLDCSAKGTVPVLVLADGRVIDESREVMVWAMTVNDPELWLPDAQSSEINSLLDSNDGEFKVHLDHYKYADRFPEHTAEFYRGQGEQFLDLLEQRLDNQRYLMSDKISLADIGIFPFIRQFVNVDSEWFYQSRYQRLQDWLDGFLESEAFIKVMDKYSAWNETSEPIVFN